jgi:RNA methyltransferase, TrmH family
MITKKKLETLKERTRLRKISIILHQAAFDVKAGKKVDWEYINDVLSLTDYDKIDTTLNSEAIVFKLEDISKDLLRVLGAEPSDWDFRDSTGALDAKTRIIQDKILVLDRIRSPYNVGAIFRSADSFGISKIILVEGTASPEHVRAQRTSMGTTATVDWAFMSEEEVVSFLKSYDPSQVLALEVGGENINTFSFPKRGVGILGSEEFGISPAVLACAGRRVSIAIGGSKGSLNVSVAAGIFMQHWYSC